ncbi:hypothetical protein B0O99DRAFT_691506 [Bisporella sp. PMI_857]|nr:hypothetical protein B0O99DRAFT_691506 [Bisporella sp. PMI_857]
MKFSLDIILVALVAFAQAHPEPVAEDAAIIEERDFPWPGPKPGPKPEPYYPCYKYGKTMEIDVVRLYAWLQSLFRIGGVRHIMELTSG